MWGLYLCEGEFGKNSRGEYVLNRTINTQRQPNRLILGLFAALMVSGTIGKACLANAENGNASTHEDTRIPNSQDELSLKTESVTSPKEALDNPIAEQLSLMQVADIRSTFHRTKTLHNLIANADETAVLELINESKALDERALHNEIQKVLIRRLALLNPRVAVQISDDLTRTISKPVLVREVFQEWSIYDLDGAVAFAKSLDESQKSAATRGILKSRSDLSPNQRKDIVLALNNQQEAIEQIISGLFLSENEDLAVIWQTILELVPATNPEFNSGQFYMIGELATAWVDEDGIDVLESINESFPKESDRVRVVGSVLEEFVPRDPGLAFELALRYGDSNLNIVKRTLRAWTRIDAKAAFDRISSIENESHRRLLQQIAIQVWAYVEPLEVLERLEKIPPEFRRLGQTRALEAIALDSPETASQMLDQVIDQGDRTNVASSIATNWAEQDPIAAINWVKNDPKVGEIQAQLLSKIVYELVLKHPHLAVQFSTEESLDGVEAEIVSQVIDMDAYQVHEWLDGVTDQTVRFSVHESIGIALVRHGHVSRSIELAEELSEPYYSRYLRRIIAQLATSDPKDLVDRIGHLPTKGHNEHAATVLLANNQLTDALSQEQLDIVTSYLPKTAVEHIESAFESLETSNDVDVP